MSDLQASLAVVSTHGVSTSAGSVPAAGAGRSRISASSIPGGYFDDAVLSFGSAGGAEPSWASGSRSGGAPAPEMNAGLGLLLAGVTFVVLRRRRGRQPARSA